MRVICCSAFFLIVVVLNVDGQYESPCPGLFAYQSDGSRVYGLIHLEHTGGPISNLHIRANFTIAAQLPSTFVGQIETIGKGQVLQKFNRGVPLKYRVHFPVTSPLPHLTSITVNGVTQCFGPGDVPAPNQYITTISLDHMLFLKPGSSVGSLFNHYEPAHSQMDPVDYFVESVGDNTLSTINLEDKGAWTSILYPADLEGNKQPVVPAYEQPVVPAYEQPVVPAYEQPVIRPHRPTQPRPSRPRPDIYYPDPTTKSPAPPTTPPTTPPPPPPIQPIPSSPSRQPGFPTQVECGVISGGNERIPLVYQGSSYPRGDLPWLVAVYKRQEGSLTFICAGTLVSARHIVTAAHCMHYKNTLSSTKDMVIKIGVYNLEDWGDDISVTRTLVDASIHESYNSTTLENDILVLTLERTVEFNTYIRPACLWNGNTDLSRIVGASGVVAGWGANEIGPVGKGEPRMVRVPVVSTAQCRASKPEFHRLTSSKTLCAGDRNGSGPCLGDSGGGMYILDNGRWRLRGIVSVSLQSQSGDLTCNLNEYVIFTDTAQYLSWIRKILSQNYFDT